MKVSIVTPVLNRADLIGEAIESVRAQTGVEVEHIIVDGGSTDGTWERLIACPGVTAILLPGSTPEEAVNEGLRRATGELVGFVMSDDRLAPGILRRVADVAADPGIDLVSTGAVFFETDHAGRDVMVRNLRRRCAIDFDYRTVLIGSLLACARFYRRRIFDRVGFFQSNYRTCNDRDLLLRMLMAGARNATVEETGYWYRSHRSSRTIGVATADRIAIHEDHLRMAEDYLGRRDLSSRHRRWLLRFHAIESARAIVASLRLGRIGWLPKLTFRAFRITARWPLLAAEELAMLIVCRAFS